MADEVEKEVAEAVKTKAEGDAAVAEAVTEQKQGEAVESVVAAAQGAAALAQVESAKAQQNAAAEIAETEGKISWLGTEMESLRANQVTQAQALEETKQSFQTSLGSLSEGMNKLLQSIQSQSTNNGTETASPQLEDQKKGAEADRQKEKKKVRRI